MAKFGPKKGGHYDPFNSISSELATLTTAPEPPKARLPVSTQVDSVGAQERPQPVAEEGREHQDRPHLEIDRGRSSVSASEQVSSPNSLGTTKRFKTTRDEARRIEAATVRLGARLGLAMDFSKVTRALWDVFLRHEEDILRNIPEGEFWSRPSNNDAVGLAELDEKVANLINGGLMVASRRPTNHR